LFCGVGDLRSMVVGVNLGVGTGVSTKLEVSDGCLTDVGRALWLGVSEDSSECVGLAVGVGVRVGVGVSVIVNLSMGVGFISAGLVAEGVVPFLEMWVGC
jgi:hypothetical protein